MTYECHDGSQCKANNLDECREKCKRLRDTDSQIKQDAARYRFLRGYFSVMSPNIDGNHYWILRNPPRIVGGNIDEAVDSAISKG